ncbi:hypothetical protein CcCBS67573_g06498 [Chytriomyces confervae]|uniref:Uncharacterized protein n=1 Tax=Chytriomyces confervae TaxID=246404 RepID=A0A507F350_9FUNG|nr:hypothetical protein CcCBS67573_g06498 [Chytriomyces confervae]
MDAAKLPKTQRHSAIVADSLNVSGKPAEFPIRTSPSAQTVQQPEESTQDKSVSRVTSTVMTSFSPCLTNSEDPESSGDEDDDDDEEDFLVMKNKGPSFGFEQQRLQQQSLEEEKYPLFTAVIAEHALQDLDVEDEFLGSDPLIGYEDDQEVWDLPPEAIPSTGPVQDIILPVLEMIDIPVATEKTAAIKPATILQASPGSVSESLLLADLDSHTNPTTARIQTELDLHALYASQANHQKATTVALSLIQDYKIVYGEQHPNIPILQFNKLAASHLAACDYSSALSVLLELYENVADPIRDPNFAAYTDAVFRVAAKTKRYTDTRRVFQTQYTRISKLVPDTHPTMLKLMHALWRTHVACNDAEQAKVVLEKCVAAMDKVLADEDADFVEAKWGLAKLYSAKDALDEARPLLESVSQLVADASGGAGYGKRQAAAKYLLARIYISERKYDAAEFLLAEAFPDLFHLKDGVVDGEVLNSALMLNTFCHLRFLRGQFAEVLRLSKSLISIGKLQAQLPVNDDDSEVEWLMVGENMRNIRLSEIGAEDGSAGTKNSNIRIGFRKDPESLLIGRGRRSSWVWNN